MKSIAMFLALATVGCGDGVQPAGKIQIFGTAGVKHLLKYGVHAGPPPNGFWVGLDGKLYWTGLRFGLRWDANKSIRYYNRKVSNMGEMEALSMSTIHESRLSGKIIEEVTDQEDKIRELFISVVRYRNGKITEIQEADHSHEEKIVAAIKAHQLAAELALTTGNLGAVKKIMRLVIRVSESVDHRVQLQVDMKDMGTVFLKRDNLDDVAQYLHGEAQSVHSEALKRIQPPVQ